MVDHLSGALPHLKRHTQIGQDAVASCCFYVLLYPYYPNHYPTNIPWNFDFWGCTNHVQVDPEKHHSKLPPATRGPLGPLRCPFLADPWCGRGLDVMLGLRHWVPKLPSHLACFLATSKWLIPHVMSVDEPVKTWVLRGSTTSEELSCVLCIAAWMSTLSRGLVVFWPKWFSRTKDCPIENEMSWR